MKDKICSIEAIVGEVFSYKKELFVGNFLALLSTLLISIIPLFIPLLVDELLLGKTHGLIIWIKTYLFTSDIKGYVFFLLFVTIFLRILSVIFAILQSKIFTIISKNISYKLRISLLEHLQKVSLKEYEMMRSGSVSSKLVSDVETIDAFVSSTISKLIIASLILVFSSIILLWIHWELALFILITNPIVVFFTAKLARNIGRLKREENKAIEVFQSTLTETLELFHQIRAANKEEYFFKKTRAKAEELKDNAIAFSYKSEAAMKFSYLIFLAGYEIFRAVSILAVAYSDLSVGLMLAIFSYLWVMVTPTQDIINFQYALATAKSACLRINDIFNMKKEPQRQEKSNPFVEDKPLDIKVKNLYFSYASKSILSNISMEIKQGTKVALVGASGAGKSTLANILLGFYPLEEGDISYGEISYRNLKLSTLREHIHLILQNPKLFNDTMLFNLTLGKNYSKEEVDFAVKTAQLKKVIEDLEDGFLTLVGKDGIKLSGGQRQRVAIARMILANPKVVIFDESTSAIDVHTEFKLFEDLKMFLADKTVITIAHRLSTIQSAGYIYVLEEGRIVDAGTPQTLLNKDESYFARMI